MRRIVLSQRFKGRERWGLDADTLNSNVLCNWRARDCCSTKATTWFKKSMLNDRNKELQEYNDLAKTRGAKKKKKKKTMLEIKQDKETKKGGKKNIISQIKSRHKS